MSSTKRTRAESGEQDVGDHDLAASEGQEVDIEEQESDMGEEDEAEQPIAGPSRIVKVSTKTSTKKRKPVISPGIVYISRLPPGMTPQKVRHLMARWGEVGKVYAQARDTPTGYNPNSSKPKKAKHTQANYSEAWVEFLDKSVAKTVAGMLNAEVIGGKKGDRWRDDIWTMKYLSGFKWEMLGEQVAYERQAHQSRLRAEIARSKTEQGEYLRNVELARVLDKRKAKKAAAGSDGAVKTGDGDGGVEKLGKSEEPKKGYRQRTAVDGKARMEGTGMESLLGNVFG